MTDEIESEIAKVNFHVANVISEFKGNYLALLKLAETLADLLNSAELDLHDIHVIPDDEKPELLPRAIGFTDLPKREKQLLISTAITSTVAVKMMATLLGCSFHQAIDHISNISSTQLESLSPEQIEDAVAELAKSLHEQPNEMFFVIQA